MPDEAKTAAQLVKEAGEMQAQALRMAEQELKLAQVDLEGTKRRVATAKATLKAVQAAVPRTRKPAGERKPRAARGPQPEAVTGALRDVTDA